MTEDDPVHAFVPYPPAPVAHATSGPLTGLTVAVKDIFDVAGYPTGCGQPTMLALSGTKGASAPIVRRFLDAGARFSLAGVICDVPRRRRTGGRAAPRRAPPPQRRHGCATSVSGRTLAVRSVGLRAIVACSASAPPMTGCRWR